MAPPMTAADMKATLEMLAGLGRQGLELLCLEALNHANELTAEVAALRTVVDADIQVADACNHANLMLFAHIDYSGPAEISYAAAVAVQREALAHYRKEHP